MYPASFLIGLTDFIIGLAELALGLRFILKLFAASASAPFVQWIYSASGSLLEPFRGIFPTAVLTTTGSVFEFSTLFAILVYALMGYLVTEFIRWLARSSQEHAV